MVIVSVEWRYKAFEQLDAIFSVDFIDGLADIVSNNIDPVMDPVRVDDKVAAAYEIVRQMTSPFLFIENNNKDMWSNASPEKRASIIKKIECTFTLIACIFLEIEFPLAFFILFDS